MTASIAAARPTLLVLNPNSSDWMTERVAAQLRARLGDRFEVSECTAAAGPAVIDSRAGFACGAAAGPAALRAHLAAGHAADAVLLACFGDPGLEALRDEAGARPVHGLAQAAMAEAAAGGRRYAVVTCGPAWVDLLHKRAGDFGLAASLVGVWALPVDGRSFALEPARWRCELQAAADAAERAGAAVLVLGGAAFAGLGPLVSSRLAVVDGIDAAARAIERDFSA